MLLILFGGFYASKLYDTYERHTIDKHGVYSKATIYQKTANSKGKKVYFAYSYNGKKYLSNEQGVSLYEKLAVDTIITIKLDSTKPESSYIITNAE
jgi:hypothetical protein